MAIEQEFEQRFSTLISQGQQLTRARPRGEHGLDYWVPDERIAEYQQWVGSTANLINLVDQPDGTFASECKRLLDDDDSKSGIAYPIIDKLLGLLAACQDEWSAGLLRRIEHIVVAEAFDDFLDHAAY